MKGRTAERSVLEREERIAQLEQWGEDRKRWRGVCGRKLYMMKMNNLGTIIIIIIQEVI